MGVGGGAVGGGGAKVKLQVTSWRACATAMPASSAAGEDDLRPGEGRPALARLHVPEVGVVDRSEVTFERAGRRPQPDRQDRERALAFEGGGDLGDDVLVVARGAGRVVLAVGEEDDRGPGGLVREQVGSLAQCGNVVGVLGVDLLAYRRIGAGPVLRGDVAEALLELGNCTGSSCSARLSQPAG